MDSASLALFAILLALTACFLHHKLTNKQKHLMDLPPGPYAWPVLGSLLSIRLPLHRYFLDLSKKYGPVVYVKLGAMQMVCVNDAESCNEVLNLRDQDFCYRPQLPTLEKFSFGYKGMLGSPYGKVLSTLRKVCSLHLFSASNMNTSEVYRVDEIQCQVKDIYNGCQGGAVNLVNLRKLSSNYNRNLMSLSLFSEVDFEVYELLEEAMECMRIGLFLGGVFPVLSRLGLTKVDKSASLDNLMPKLEAAITKQFEKHRARKDAEGDSFKPVDFVDALLCLPDEYEVPNISMVALLVDLFAGGIETTRALIEYTMGEVINHPEVMQKAQEELDQVVGRSQWVGETGPPYIQAIVKEALRLHPPGPLGGPHCNPKESTIGGYRIPAGCCVVPNIWALGNDPKYWKDADKFMPERFLAQVIGINGQYPGYIPFSRGRRGCVGTALGMRSAVLAVGTLIQAFDWKPPPGQAKLDLKEGTDSSLAPAAEVVAAATPRLPQHMYAAPRQA